MNIFVYILKNDLMTYKIKARQVLLFTSFLMLFGCAGSDDSMGREPDVVVDAGDPIANDDFYEVREESELFINNLLSNDTVVDKAQLTQIDSNSANGGSITPAENGTYMYAPAAGFSGTDTFSYTLCDDDTPTPTCSTATVTITVTDEGNPLAVDDAFEVFQNTATILDEFLLNDSLIDEAVLFAVDAISVEGGEVVLNADGTITYTPVAEFIGADSFTYTLCDDDSPASCGTATVSLTVKVDNTNEIAFNIPAGLQDYYSAMTFWEDPPKLYDELATHTIQKHTNILQYTERHNYLYNADADLANSNNVVLMYTSESRYWEEYTSGSNSYQPQTFNTEHVYPQSLISDQAITDLHHLRACDDGINSMRSNYPFVDGTGTYQLINNNTWFPGDEWKGDIARMIFYLNIRYNEEFTEIGGLDLFLKWNAEDPVSDFENQRNQIITGAQGNRNPFIDNPYLATAIWGASAAANTWQ
jgi:endonuclease I